MYIPGGANRLVEDCDVRAFFVQDKELLAGGEEGSGSGRPTTSRHKRNLNRAQRTRPLPSLRPKKCRLNLTTNQLKYRLCSYSTEIIGLGESSCSTSAKRQGFLIRAF